MPVPERGSWATAPARRRPRALPAAKGSATTDPDGYPLHHAGSRDNRLRVIALSSGAAAAAPSTRSATARSPAGRFAARHAVA